MECVYPSRASRRRKKSDDGEEDANQETDIKNLSASEAHASSSLAVHPQHNNVVMQHDDSLFKNCGTMMDDPDFEFEENAKAMEYDGSIFPICFNDTYLNGWTGYDLMNWVEKPEIPLCPDMTQVNETDVQPSYWNEAASDIKSKQPQPFFLDFL